MLITHQFVLASLVSSVAFCSIGIFVYFSNRKGQLNRLFFVYALLITFWSFCQALLFWHQGPGDKLKAWFWGSLQHVGVFFIPALFLHFILTFLGKVGEKKKILISAYIVGFFFAILLPTKLLIKDMVPVGHFKYIVLPNKLYYFYMPVFSFYLAYPFCQLHKAMSHLTGVRRNQIKYFFWSSLFAYLGASFNFSLPMGKELYPVNPYATYAVPICVGFIAYAIVRHHLLDIRVAAARIAIFIAVYFVVLWIPFIIGYQTKSWVTTGGLMFALATAGPFIYNRIRRGVEARLLVRRRAEQKALENLSRELLHLKNPADLEKDIIKGVCDVFKPFFAVLYMRDSRIKAYQLKQAKGLSPGNMPETITVDNLLALRLFRHKSALLGSAPLLKAMFAFTGEAVIIPFLCEGDLAGFLIVGSRESGEPYDNDDLSVSSLFGINVSLALENSVLHQRGREKDLQIQTLLRQTRIAHLSSSVGHTINNKFNQIAVPLSTFTACAELDPPEPDYNLLKERYQELLGLSTKVLETARVGSMISRQIMDSAKLSLNPESVDAEKVMRVGILMSRLKWGPGLKINEDFDPNPKPVWFSPAYLEDCVTNAGNNSTDAIHEKLDKIRAGGLDIPGYEGQITIRTRYDTQHAYLEIKDNGIGIPEDKLKEVGEAYYSSKYQAGKGTGLGVYSIKQQVEAHGGQVEIESVYTKGTTLRITLPLAQDKQGE